MTRCAWCLDLTHSTAFCPSLRQAQTATHHGIIDPMHAEDPQDQLALRCHALRAALRGVLTDAKRAGWVFTAETAALIANTDPFEV